MARILIVDDKEENVSLLEDLLTGLGHTVAAARNGADALQEARQFSPDLIVADILMPVMDGFTLCRQWRQDPLLKDRPFMFLTATYTDPKDEEFALSLGADRFVLKPVEPDVLIAQIDDLLNRHQKGQPAAEPKPSVPPLVLLQQYNEALIRKLEDKLADTERANRELALHRKRLQELVDARTSELKKANEELTRQYRELEKHSDELERLTAHLDIREEESRRISREIHEEFGNALAAARFNLLDVQGRIPDDHPELAERISSILSEQASLIDRVRNISQHLRPPILDQLGLVPALRWLADDFELRTGTKCLVRTEVLDESKRGRPYASAIYRICQEALSNVARHADSDRAEVLFSENEREAVLVVTDQGKGFNLSESSMPSIGIIDMRERARYCGGTFDLITSPGRGTKVVVRIPLQTEAGGAMLEKP